MLRRRRGARATLGHVEVGAWMQPESFRELNEDELDWLAAQRGRVEALLAGNAEALAEYESDAGKLAVIRAVLNARAFRPDQTFELQGLGVIFGDVLASQLNMQWRVLEDQQGISPCPCSPAPRSSCFRKP
jgi:hypothetical protein